MAGPSPARVAKLLLKAIRSLPEKEQQAVLEHLIGIGLREPAEPVTRHLRRHSPDALRQVARREGERVVGDAVRLERGPEPLLRFTPAPRPEQGQAYQMIPMRLSEQQHRLLKQWCADHGFPMAVVVRGLVERFLEEQEGRAA